MKFWGGLAVLLTLLMSLVAIAGTASKDVGLYLSFEERLAFSYALQAVGVENSQKAELFGQASEVFARYKSQRTVVNIESFDQFLSEFRGNWPNSHSLSSDLNLILYMSRQGLLGYQKEFTFSNDQLKKEVEEYLANQKKQTYDLALSSGLWKSSFAIGSSIIHKLIVPGTDSAVKSDVQKLLSDVFVDLESHAMNEIHRVAEQGQAQLDRIDMKGRQDDAIFQFVVEIMKNYFGGLSLQSKKHALSLFAGEDLNAGPLDKFSTMVKASGPQFQKLLQVLARDGANFSAEFIEVFRRLESNNQSVPSILVKRLFEAEKANYQWLSYDLNPLGTGTMAQVHLAEIKVNNQVQKVVVRFLKPEIEQRVAEDYQILRAMAPVIDANPNLQRFGFPKVTPLVEDLNRTISDELDLAATVNRQRQAKQSYERELFFKGEKYKNYIQVQVPEVYGFYPGTKLHVQELVPGTKLDRWADDLHAVIPDFKKVLIEKMAAMWIEEVLFRSGFFHSDLHQGNFLVEFTEPAIKVGVLDFGMGGVISKELQSDFLVYGAAIELNEPQKLTDILWKIADKEKTAISYQDLYKLMVARTKQIDSKSIRPQSFQDWTAWAMNNGVRFPYVFVSLNRGVGILEKSLADAKSTKTVEDIVLSFAGKYGVKSIWNLYQQKSLTKGEIFQLSKILAKDYVKSTSSSSSAAVKCSVVYAR